MKRLLAIITVMLAAAPVLANFGKQPDIPSDPPNPGPKPNAATDRYYGMLPASTFWISPADNDTSANDTTATIDYSTYHIVKPASMITVLQIEPTTGRMLVKMPPFQGIYALWYEFKDTPIPAHPNGERSNRGIIRFNVMFTQVTPDANDDVGTAVPGGSTIVDVLANDSNYNPQHLNIRWPIRWEDNWYGNETAGTAEILPDHTIRITVVAGATVGRVLRVKYGISNESWSDSAYLRVTVVAPPP